MKLGRLILVVGVALLTVALTTMPVFAAQGGNGNGKAGNNGQGSQHANENSAVAEGDDAAETSGSGSSSSSGSSSQVCDGDSGGNSDTGHGANQGDTYDNTCPHGPSGNGNGGGNATGRPCAGCVGQADDKNPPGQAPGPEDHNNGYECDGNNGIGRTNPAHTGCRSVPPPPPPSLGSAANVPSLPCGSNSLTVSMTNLNNAAGGNRVFLVKLDGVTVDTETLASGASGTSTVTIPNDGQTHTVSVTTDNLVVDSETVKVETVCSQVGAAAAITDIPCGDATADITATNSDASGTRVFTGNLDGIPASSASVAAGSSATFVVSVPDDSASHVVSVSSNGATLASKTLKVTKCPTTQVLGVQFSKGGPTVLGAALPRTGFAGENLLILSLASIGVGMALQTKKRKVAVR